MNIFTILKKRSKAFYAFLAALGIVNSILNGSLLILINGAISGEPLPYFAEYRAGLFVVVVVASYYLNQLFQKFMIKLTNQIVNDFEIALLDKIRRARYEAFEKLGNEKVYTAIGDSRALGQIPQFCISFINAATIALCGVSYVFLTSPWGGAGIIAVMVFLLVFYLVQNKKIEKDLNKLRDLQNDYHRYLKDFLLGFREVKMSISRSENIYHHFLKETLVSSRRLGVSTSVRFMTNELTGNYSWYIVIGVIIFALPPLLGMAPKETTTLLITILFLIGPIATLISIVPFFTRVKIALQRLDALETEIRERFGSPDPAGASTEPPEAFRSIAFANVCYSYFDKASNKTFELGPISLRVEQGETIYITGGNGSGKSTFVSLLAGLYRPVKGCLRLNDNEITPENYPAFCDQVSVIFANNYLFNENYDGFDLNPHNEELAGHVRLLQLGDTLKFDERKNHISTQLSKGQQKRLALIYALMEKKQILVLDEWAAEQDPRFRAYFYRVLLPELKQQGKTVIVVTHDDEYYPYADRLIKFSHGKIVSDEVRPLLEEPVAKVNF